MRALSTSGFGVAVVVAVDVVTICIVCDVSVVRATLARVTLALC